MSEHPDRARRWLIGASGAALVSRAFPLTASYAQNAAPPLPAGDANPEDSKVSPATDKLADYIAGTLDRELPANIVAATKLHVLDTFAAMVSGSRLKPGALAARYVDSLGGKPQATVIGTGLVTSSVLAAFSNAMSAHADETDDTDPIGPVHLGSGAVSAALAAAELTGRSGGDMLRAVTLAYDIGARIVSALGVDETSKRYSPSCIATSFVAASAAAALLRLDRQQVRHTISYAAQQASGIGYWTRDPDHIEKAFDFAGMGARNGVMAATMVAMGFTGVEDPFIGGDNVYASLAEKPAPEKLIAGLGTDYAVLDTTIKKWTVGTPLQSVLDSVAALIEDPGVRADNIKHIKVEVMTASLRIVDNATSPDLSLQHLVAMMIVDRGATFASVHDAARMSDPKVLAVRKLVELAGSEELQKAKPPRQAIVRIDLADGRSLSHRTTIVRGTAGNPVSAQEVEAKALDLMTPVLGAGRAKDLIAAVQSLDTFGAVSGLRPLLQA
ncbi:MAG TPA: MmgE/PrpD family protein [Beijerinckiaceae bacterium]|jgi:2-methylcitrate dehydratase PrpD|nr:MmgE/PrpD family protein [Beijerinckiaceae bacterium]